VGVLDVYYIGDALPQYIADYILVVGVDLVVGRTTIWGTEIQDICVLGWPVGNNGVMNSRGQVWIITKPSGDLHYIYDDPLGQWTSCEDLALAQKAYLGLGIPWT
jgi:hypothetical protein